jgi:hypothetical protein
MLLLLMVKMLLQSMLKEQVLPKRKKRDWKNEKLRVSSH